MSIREYLSKVPKKLKTQIEMSEKSVEYKEVDGYNNEIVAVKPFSETIYMHDQNNNIIKSNDGGETTETIEETYTSRSVFCTIEGTLLVYSGNNLYRSTDEGDNWSEVLSNLESGWRLNTIMQHENSETIIFGENPTNGDNPSLYRSTDDGENWTEILSRNVRHWHSVQVDPFTGEWIATSGDSNSNTHWVISDDDGENWTDLIGNAADIDGRQIYRTLGIAGFHPDRYIWGSDAPNGVKMGDNDELGPSNWIVSAPKNDLTNITYHTMTAGTCYAFAQQGQSILIGTATNRKGEGSYGVPPVLYYSNDFGENWEKVLEFTPRHDDTWGDFSRRPLLSAIHPVPDYKGHYYMLTRDLDENRTIKLKIK